MDDHELELYERYLERLSHQIDEFERRCQYIKKENPIQQLEKDAIRILREKVEYLYNAKSEKEIKKVLRLKKAIEREGKMRQ